MPRADFYLIAKPRFRTQPLLLVCRLVQKALDAAQPLLVLCADQAQAEELDDLLWAFDDEAFIPHQLAGSEDDNEVPVLILAPGVEALPRPLLINLRREVPPPPFERVLEVVSADPDQREGSRQRWQQYRQAGIEVDKFDM